MGQRGRTSTVIVDASALVTVALKELGFEPYLEMLLRSRANRVSAATFLEAAILVDRLPNSRPSVRFDELISDLEISIEPMTAHQATIAREACRRFDKGSGHPARLNFATALPTRWRRISMSRCSSSGRT